MKETNSETTTTPEQQHSSIGTQLGALGSATPSSMDAAREPQTVAEWQSMQKQQRLQIGQLASQQVKKRNAELIAMLEVASAKIDRFGWDRMSQNVKDALCADWCDRLGQYTLAEVKQGVKDLFSAHKGKLRSINEYQVEEQITFRHRAITARLTEQDKIREQMEARKPDLTDEEIARRKQVAADAMKGFPKEQSEQETQNQINAAKDQIENMPESSGGAKR